MIGLTLLAGPHGAELRRRTPHPLTSARCATRSAPARCGGRRSRYSPTCPRCGGSNTGNSSSRVRSPCSYRSCSSRFSCTRVFNYAEYLVFLLFTIGHAFLWRAGLALIALVPDGPRQVLSTVDFFLFVIYFGWALRGFHRGRVRYLWLRVVAAILATLVHGTIINLPLQLLRSGR